MCGIAVTICLVNFVALNSPDRGDDWETFQSHGYFSVDAIRDGAWHGLITSVFVHIEFWHVAFNVYWLWVLGSRFEREFGTPKFVAFFLSAGFVSSATQLAHTDDTGIGASGVAYALFGFMWPVRSRFPSFRAVITPRIAGLFVLWALLCVVATYWGSVPIGNAAHLSGMLFGGAVAGLWVTRFRPQLMAAGLIVLMVLAVVPLFWAPWSTGWLSQQAYDAQITGDLPTAHDLYTQVLARDPDNAWAWYNRGTVNQGLGRDAQAEVDFDKAAALDRDLYGPDSNSYE